MLAIVQHVGVPIILAGVKHDMACSCCPLTCHNVSSDIPIDQRHIVWTALLAWAAAASGYVVNLLIMMILLSSSHKSLLQWVIASMIIILGMPLSWRLWYSSLYWSQATGQLRRHVAFCVHGSFRATTCVWVIVSPPILVGALGSHCCPAELQEETTAACRLLDCYAPSCPPPLRTDAACVR
jgi:SCAMP family